MLILGASLATIIPQLVLFAFGPDRAIKQTRGPGVSYLTVSPNPAPRENGCLSETHGSFHGQAPLGYPTENRAGGGPWSGAPCGHCLWGPTSGRLYPLPLQSL